MPNAREYTPSLQRLPKSAVCTDLPRGRSTITKKLADYAELAKPRIAALALFTVALGFTLAADTRLDATLLANALIGIGLVAISSTSLNQLFERDTDARMARTANRPLPAGRLTVAEAATFGVAVGMIGTLWLLRVNGLTAALALCTLLIYVLAYTPLKRRTAFCTSIGAVAGAMPPVLGWVAAGGKLDAMAACLFGILFFWQYPHFLAIGRLYQTEYDGAGLKMLPSAAVARSVSILFAVILIPVSLVPAFFGEAGNNYLVAAILLGSCYLAMAIRFAFLPDEKRARELIYTSLIYLPLLLLALLWSHAVVSS
ncbi:heme o synthase [Planctomycetota bacterium]